MCYFQKEKSRKRVVYGTFSGAGGGGRTRTGVSPTDFESASSANSNTPAKYSTFRIHDFSGKVKAIGEKNLRGPGPGRAGRIFTERLRSVTFVRGGAGIGKVHGKMPVMREFLYVK